MKAAKKTKSKMYCENSAEILVFLSQFLAAHALPDGFDVDGRNLQVQKTSSSVAKQPEVVNQWSVTTSEPSTTTQTTMSTTEEAETVDPSQVSVVGQILGTLLGNLSTTTPGPSTTSATTEQATCENESQTTMALALTFGAIGALLILGLVALAVVIFL